MYSWSTENTVRKKKYYNRHITVIYIYMSDTSTAGQKGKNHMWKNDILQNRYDRCQILYTK